MKRKEKASKNTVKQTRKTRADRKREKLEQRRNEELLICKQNIEFHKAYLAIELGREEIKYEDLQARITALQGAPEGIETVETVETSLEKE